MRSALFLILALALVSCAPRGAAPPRSSPAKAESKSRFEKPPFVGMTKTQAAARYGKPRRRVLTEEGERWDYVLNATEVRTKALNPLSLTVPKYRTGALVFGASGKVKRFAWEAKPDR